MISWKKSWNQLKFLVKTLIPTRRFLFIVGFSVVVIALGALIGQGIWFFLVVNGGLILLILFDVGWIHRPLPNIQVTRKVESLLELSHVQQVSLTIQSDQELTTTMWIQDDYPQGFWVDRATLGLSWNGQKEQQIQYAVKPHRRGRHQFQSVHLRFLSGWGLFLYQLECSQPMETHVYPSLEPIRKVHKGYYQRQPMDMGRRLMNRFGTGKEFSHLKEYSIDDDSRKINWLATARSGRVVSNFYQPEIGQRVLILLDCGRLMGVQHQGRSQFDITLEAVLDFASMVIARGDQLSFIAFSDRMLRHVPYGSGMGHLQSLIEATYDLEPSYVETDYLSVSQQLFRGQKQQTLVALFTDMGNCSFSQTIHSLISLVKKHHRLLTVTLQDASLKDMLDVIPEFESMVYQQAVVEEMVMERRATLKKWNSKQIVTLDVQPDQLASAVIDTYLTMKRP